MARRWAFAAVPLALLALALAAFVVTRPLAPLGVTAPPVERLTVERARLDRDGIALRVRAGGSAPVTIAQVQVDGAYWDFRQHPPGPLERLQAAWIEVPYPWVQGEAHHVTVVTETGATFEHTIEVATASPRLGLGRIAAYGLLGLYVGVLPVGLGVLFYPFLRTLGGGGLQFLLALTLGLLAFLLVDTLAEARELAERAASGFEAPVLIWLVAAVAFLALIAAGRRGRGPPEGVALAWYIALGIGLHNLGEGLAIGGAFAVGKATLGAFLVVGFTLHNLTEGIAIAAPIVGHGARPPAWIGLVALAGLPAVAGSWIGAFAYSPLWAALFLAVGVGAIGQVIVEVGRHLWRRTAATASAPAASLAGFAAGVLAMYGTGLLVQV